MNQQKNCVYCGKLISETSKEHIIQNAIGGLYESEDICCKDCNTYVSLYIDTPFTKLFNPIISNIKNLTKTHNKKSRPTCTGKAIYKEKIYKVFIKNGKVVSCPELSRKLKCDISNLDLKIVEYDFSIENTPFKNGISKIAFNFAIDKGISINILKKGLNVKEVDGKIKEILFDYKIIPFVALNLVDEYIELYTETEMELYHNLILFNQGKMLWCYVDLFNTFQCYVLLSEEFNDNISINETYFQFIETIDRTIPKLDIRRVKDIYTYAMQFNIEPCMDIKELKKRVKEVIQKKSVKKNMADAISSKLGYEYSESIIENNMYLEGITSLQMYFDEDERLNDTTFRQITYDKDAFFNNNLVYVSYPEQIDNLIKSGKIDKREYTHNKLKRLNSLLVRE